jgi:D-alanyl-D-alanine carboxypeptidase (penicillin-binding protein 5/6)
LASPHQIKPRVQDKTDLARFRLTVEVRSTPAAPRNYVPRPKPSSPSHLRRRWGWLSKLGLALAVLLFAAATFNFLRPIPEVVAATSVPVQSTIPGSPPSLPWPGVGSAAVGASDLGLIGTSGDAAPAPTASVAKVMTALVLLADKPLKKGEAGPILTITDQDVATYLADLADQQSVVRVRAGEQLSQFAALEALLIPSGNNIAETLARWDAGSVAAFVSKMNQRAAALHLTRTTFADPAGASIQTVSTATDLLALGMAAMQQEVIAQIVNLSQTTLPVAGTVYNVNAALGQSGIVGIKTGSGLNSGANFLFAAAATIDGSPVTLYGCVMGQPTLDAAFKAAEALIKTMQAAVTVRQVTTRNGVVGAYQTAWGSRSDLVATSDATLVEWPGMILRQRLDAQTIVVDRPTVAGMSAGKLHIVLGDQQLDVPLVIAGSLDPPGTSWRLFRINLF